MREDRWMKEGYDALTSLIMSCVRECSYSELAGRRILTVAMSEERQLRSFSSSVRALRPQAEFSFVVQPSMCLALQDIMGQECEVLEWEGNYTPDLIGKLQERFDMRSFDAFLYFSIQPVNLRNGNLMEIAEELERLYSMKIYGIDATNMIYEYRHVGTYNRAVRLYTDIDGLIVRYLSDMKLVGGNAI